MKLQKALLVVVSGLLLWSAALAQAAEVPAKDAPNDVALRPPPVNLKPGPEYADGVRMFQGIPGIERAKNGRLWATWYGGGVTEDQHNYIMLVTSGDDGATWSSLKLVIDPDRDGPCRAFDPCLWHDPQGRLWLSWAERHKSVQLWAISTADSGSETPQWSAPQLLHEGIMMNKPLFTAGGTWLLPVAGWHQEGSSRVVDSTDQGATFQLCGKANVPEPKERNCDEHMLVERKDGSLWLLVRTGYGIGESVSSDRGKTWSAVERSTIPHTVSRFFISRLVSGRLLLVRHDGPEHKIRRSHLTAFLSDDEGKTWQGGLLLDERNGVSYPDGVQAPDGTIRIIYDFNRTKEKQILMARFTEEDVLQERLVSQTARLQVLVNQATGVNPAAKAPKVHKSHAATAVRDANVDGVPLLVGPAAGLEIPAGASSETFQVGVKLFTDRRYTAAEVPAALRGMKFIRAGLGGGRFVCRRPGAVLVATPTPGRNRDSVAAALLKGGFRKVALPEFMVFPAEPNVCTLYQKELAKDELLNLGSWGVVILPGKDVAVERWSSVELAATTNTLQVWDAAVPFPPFDEMPDLDVVTHVAVERAQPEGFHYLHESAIAWHKDRLHLGWANHRFVETNEKEELLRGRTSADGGFTWSPATDWVAPPFGGGAAYNHPVMLSHEGKLWGFFTRWEAEQPRAELFTLDEAAGTWTPKNAHIPGFIPFCPPHKLSDGNWIIGGEQGWKEPAVAISHGSDFTKWDVVQLPRPAELQLLFPETTLVDRGDELLALCRPKGVRTAPASVSRDGGRTWTPLRLSNLPLAESKPLAGKLSTGQQYLIFNDLDAGGRWLLSIAVTAPGGRSFCRVWKIRHQQFPKRRLLGSQAGSSHVGDATEWSYPAAVEHDGKLYVSYTHGKEDCALSIIPLTALAVPPP
jgi:hypothetical protein